MSDTYNPDEFIRCKHLNEFARQLGIKLDGGTDPKPNRPITYIHVSKGSQIISIPNRYSGSYSTSMTVSELGKANNKSRYSLSVYTPLDIVPQILNVTSPNDTWTEFKKQQMYHPTTGAPYWSCGVEAPDIVSQPTSVAFTLHFDETPQYAAYDLRVTVIILADE